MGSLKGFNFRNIIVRMPNWIGDLVMATPILTDLRKAYPEARITAMCRGHAGDLLQADPEIDELFCFNKVNGFSRRDERRNIVEKLRCGKYDLGILLTHSLSSTWWFWQGKVKKRIGSDCNGRRLLLTNPVALPENFDRQHLVITYKMLLEPLGIPISDTLPRLFLTPLEISNARQLVKQYGFIENMKVVGINPGATYGSAKCWLPERFREVANRLLNDPSIFVLFFGDSASAPLVKEICRELPPRVVNLAGLTTVRELSALISLCDVLLTNDSGPMHIADALGVKNVALFGSTSEIVTGPYRNGKVINKHVECSPCYKRTCPIDFRCMKQISSDEVYREICAILENKDAKKSLSIIRS